MPKPIQIALAYDPDAERLHRMALCSDGSMWTWEHDGSYGGRWHWVQMPGIPEAAAQDSDIPSGRSWREGPDVWR